MTWLWRTLLSLQVLAWPEEVVAIEQDSATNIPDTSRNPSSLASLASDKSESEEEELAVPPKKKEGEDEFTAGRPGILG